MRVVEHTITPLLSLPQIWGEFKQATSAPYLARTHDGPSWPKNYSWVAARFASPSPLCTLSVMRNGWCIQHTRFTNYTYSTFHRWKKLQTIILSLLYRQMAGAFWKPFFEMRNNQVCNINQLQKDNIAHKWNNKVKQHYSTVFKNLNCDAYCACYSGWVIVGNSWLANCARNNCQKSLLIL